ncbi:unnamed protein product [Symbiodinium sp. CCMP2592]|nr:unnamed protein product [Symbiodinium sp. CCMP2592]
MSGYFNSLTSIMAELWEFIENPQPSGDGVSLIPQDWAPVENVLRPTEIVLLLAGLQTRGNISAVWRLISANRQDMLVYQSYMAPFPKLVFRPRTERSILLKAYASLTPTTVRFQMKYATTDNVALDLELPVHGGISMYDLLSAVQDGLTPPPGVGVQLLSTAHVQRPLTIFDCMVFMDEWTFQELEAKILAVGEFLMQQQTDLVEKSFKSVKATQLKQVLEDISGFVTLTAEQATRIGTILRRGPWDQEDRAIAAACLSNVLANTGRKGGAVVRRANQDLLSFHKFLSKNDACVLADPSASMHTKADVVASRMVKIQLWLASEQAYSEVIKTVQAAGAEMSSAQDQYAFLQLLKKMVRSRVKKLPKNIELPNPFPDKPEDLPDHVRAEAYNPEDPAVTIEGSVAKGSIMRKSSSELRPQDVQVALPSKKPRTSFSSNQPSQQEMFAGMASQFASFMMNYMNGNPSGSSGSNAAADLPGFRILQPPKGQGKQSPGQATDLQHGAHGQASQESSPPPQPQQSLATLRPELQSPTQQAPSQVQVTDANMGFTQFEMPDTSRPELEEREPDRQPLSAAAAALAVEKAVENRNEKTKPGILKKPAAAETAAPKAKAKATAKVKAKSTPKAKAKSQSKKTTINQGPNKGWVVEVRERRVGNSAGQTDTYYRSPHGPTRNIQGHFETEARREDVSYIDPLAVLWHACNQGGGFQEFLQNCVLYFSLKQFGGLALSKEDSWFVLTAVRSTDVKRLSNGMTQLMKRIFAIFLLDRRDQLLHGVRLPMPNQQYWMLCLLIADEAALKSVWEDKGASGTKLCFMCQNVVSHSSGLHNTDASGSLVSHVSHQKSQMVQQTDASIKEAAQHLTQCRPLMNKGEFKKRQFALGLNFCEHGALFSPELKEILRPISVSMFDYMHNYVVGGVFHVEMSQLLEALQKQGIQQDEMHSFLSACQWPAAVGDKGASAKKVFAKKVTEFKSSASEAMALYPVMRAFLQEKLPSIRDNQCKECCRCFFVLCEVLDLLYKTSVPLDPSTLAAALEQKIETHMELFKRCYGVEKVIPKAHFNLHLGDLLRRHGLLLSCFVHERRHKEIKRYANNLDSMQAGSERHILQLELEEHMKNLLVFSEMKAGLVNPKAAAGQVQQAFCDYFSLPGSPGLLVSMSCHVGNGRLCKREDVVVVHGPNGDEVAQVWFHVEFNGHGYTCMSEWRSLGRNRFRTCDEPVFRSTHAICRLCAFKKETDRALVIPLSMPM